MWSPARTQPQGPNPHYLQRLFRSVDKDGSGTIDAVELQSALSNGTWKSFNADTIRMIIHMFDHKRRGNLNFDEFVAAWKYITSWLSCFQTFDRDNSGAIDKQELSEALTRFGYRLAQPTVDFMVAKFDRDGKGSMNFDDFIQCCVTLHTMTEAFRRHDVNQNGWITISYEEFLKTGMSLMM